MSPRNPLFLPANNTSRASMKAAIDRAIGTIAEKRMFIVGLYVDPGINLDNQSSTVRHRLVNKNGGGD